jgi:hypothetical protein
MACELHALYGEINMKIKTNIRVGLRKCGSVLA